jgi:hypothetical protein
MSRSQVVRERRERCLTMQSSLKLAFVSLVGFAFGTVMLVSWFPRLAVARSPVVTGNVVARTPIKEWGVPRVDFTIEIPGSSAVVHAHTQRYLMDRVPAQVRIRYSGDPSRQVYLFEHEENPLWIGLFCYAASAFLGAILVRRWATFRGA